MKFKSLLLILATLLCLLMLTGCEALLVWTGFNRDLQDVRGRNADGF
jgi:hypothetical protein